MVRASALQSVDLGFIPLVESYRKTLKMVSIASLLDARHLWEAVENKSESSLVVSLERHLTGRPTFMWKTGDPEMATPKRVRTYCPKHSDTSLSREWRINMANKKNNLYANFTLMVVLLLQPIAY